MQKRLPKGWGMTRLGEVCELINGYAFKSENYVDNGIRVIRITNVQKGEIVDGNPKFYPSDTKEPIENYKLLEGDLLISLTGNVGRAGLLRKELLPAALNQRVACLRVDKGKINLGFLFSLLNRNDFEDDCIRTSSGVAQKNLSTVWLSKYNIPLPPPPTQKKIAEILDEADSLRKLRKQADEKMQNLIPSLFVRMFGDPATNPKGWRMARLGEVCEVIAGQSPEGKYYNDAGNGLPFYQGKKEFTEKFIGEPTTWTTSITKEARQGDILMSVRAPVGPVNFSTERICIGRGLAVIRATKQIDKEFLFNFLLKHENEIVGNAGAVFNSINKTQIENISIPLPPLPLQQEFAARVEEIEAEKTRQADSKTKLDELFNSLMQRAFTGELVV